MLSDIYFGLVYKLRVIGHMYKFCLLTTASLACDIEAESDGSGAGGRAAKAIKVWLMGNPKRPATLWSVAYRWGPSYRGLRRPEVRENCASALYTVVWIGGRGVQKRQLLALGH
jgi:hypothetical protein